MQPSDLLVAPEEGRVIRVHPNRTMGMCATEVSVEEPEPAAPQTAT